MQQPRRNQHGQYRKKPPMAYNRYVGKFCLNSRDVLALCFPSPISRRDRHLLDIQRIAGQWWLLRLWWLLLLVGAVNCFVSTKSRLLLHQRFCFTKLWFWIHSASKCFGWEGDTNEPHHCAWASYSRIVLLLPFHEATPGLLLLFLSVGFVGPSLVMIPVNEGSRNFRRSLVIVIASATVSLMAVVRCRQICSDTPPHHSSQLSKL